MYMYGRSLRPSVYLEVCDLIITEYLVVVHVTDLWNRKHRHTVLLISLDFVMLHVCYNVFTNHIQLYL